MPIHFDRPGRRRQGGFASKKLLVWAVIAFASYSSCSFLPAWMKQTQLEGAVASVLENGKHTLPDGTIRAKAVSAATSVSIPLAEEDVEIFREQREGERIVHVEFEYPVIVSYLGSQRELVRQVQVAHSFEVDEAAEARREKQEQERQRTRAESRRRDKAAMNEYKSRIVEKCRSATKGDFVASHVSITYPGGHSEIVDCSTAYRWERE